MSPPVQDESICRGEPSSSFPRRDMLAGMAGAAVATVAGISAPRTSTAEDSQGIRKGRIKQSVCAWCYNSITLEQLAAHCVTIGVKSIELTDPDDWPLLRKYGLICAMTGSHPIEKGLNRTENHDECISLIRRSIDLTADAGFPNVVCFSGNREGMDDDAGLRNCELGVKKVVGYAEKKKINLIMELLNSKVNHKDYMCDRTHWGAELVQRVGSPNFKLLYDIYHMQVQEGDVIATIRKYSDYIGHYHTAGVPGRHELDDTQELNYPPIIRAIIETGFTGYLGQEFIPIRDPLTSLTEAVELCDV